MSDWNATVIDEFRSNGARSPRSPAAAAAAHAPGSQDRRERTNPLAYFRDGDDYVVVASKGGAPTNPDWYHNLLAQPDATIEVGTDELSVNARPAGEQERERLWAMITSANPAFAEYETKTERSIPVMILTPTT